MCVGQACERCRHALELAPDVGSVVRSNGRGDGQSFEPDLPSDRNGTSTKAVSVLVTGDRVEPYAEITVLAELVAMARYRQPRFLEQVFGLGCGPGQASEKPPHPRPVDSEDVVQRARLLAAEGQNQVTVDVHSVL